MTIRAILPVARGLLLMVACQQPKPAPHKDYTRLRGEDPRSILVVPAVNRTVDVTAADYFLSTLSVPVAERGFYVYPVYLVKRLLEDDGLSDATLVHQADPRRLGAIFGADAVLYVTINKWDAKYAVISTSVEVEFEYVLKSAKTGDELWRNHVGWVYVPQNHGSGNGLVDLIAMAVQAGMTKAAPNYMPLAHQANAAAFYPAHRGLPAGPHQDKHGQDQEQF